MNRIKFFFLPASIVTVLLFLGACQDTIINSTGIDRVTLTVLDSAGTAHAGARVYDVTEGAEQYIGRTDDDGYVDLIFADDDERTVLLRKDLFLETELVLEPGPDSITTAELVPEIIFPDHGNLGIIRIDGMDGTNRREIDLIDDVGFDPSRTPELHAVAVDYHRGFVYAFVIEQGEFNREGRLIRISDIDSPGTAVVFSGDEFDGDVRQMTVTDDGDVLLGLESGWWPERGITRFIDGTAYGPVRDDDDLRVTGITRLASGRIVYVGYGGTAEAERVKGPSFWAEPEPLFTGVGAAGEYETASPIGVAALDGRIVIGDAGNNRLVSVSEAGDDWAERDDADGLAFDDPFIHAVLPDNHVYVFDPGNARLVALAGLDDPAPLVYAPTDPGEALDFVNNYFNFS